MTPLPAQPAPKTNDQHVPLVIRIVSYIAKPSNQISGYLSGKILRTLIGQHSTDN